MSPAHSLTLTAHVSGFSSAVLVQFPAQGMRRSAVLKSVKAIAHAVHGAPVRWDDIVILESPFEDAADQATHWPILAANGGLDMYDIAADGTFRRVGTRQGA